MSYLARSETKRQSFNEELSGDCYLVAYEWNEFWIDELNRKGKPVSDIEKIIELRKALMVLLSAIDYMSGMCRSNEMIGAILTEEELRYVKKIYTDTQVDSSFHEWPDNG